MEIKVKFYFLVNKRRILSRIWKKYIWNILGIYLIINLVWVRDVIVKKIWYDFRFDF